MVPTRDWKSCRTGDAALCLSKRPCDMERCGDDGLNPFQCPLEKGIPTRHMVLDPEPFMCDTTGRRNPLVAPVVAAGRRAFSGSRFLSSDGPGILEGGRGFGPGARSSLRPPFGGH